MPLLSRIASSTEFIPARGEREFHSGSRIEGFITGRQSVNTLVRLAGEFSSHAMQERRFSNIIRAHNQIEPGREMQGSGIAKAAVILNSDRLEAHS